MSPIWRALPMGIGTSPSKAGSVFSSLDQGRPWLTPWPTACAEWLWRTTEAGPKSHTTSTSLAPLLPSGCLTFETQPPRWIQNQPIWRNPPMWRKWRSPAGRHHRIPGVWVNEPSLWFQLSAFKSSSNPRHCRAQNRQKTSKTLPCCALYGFLPHKICEHNTWLFYNTKWGGRYFVTQP